MSPRWLALAVGVAALLVHARARWGDFVFHDDYRYVVNNTAIDRVGDPLRFFTDLATLSPHAPTEDIYRPLRTLSYAVITAVAGKGSAAPFHAVAIALHALTAALLAALLLRAGLPGFGAAAGALFFGLHPATVEVTAWVCSLGDAWCGLLSVASVLLYAADRRVLALFALAVALFGKEHAVVVPGLWILWDALVRPERLRGDRLPGTLLRGAAPAAALVLAFLLFRAEVAGARTLQVDEPIGGSHLSAALTMTAGLGWYAATILFPYGPTFDAIVEVRDTPFDGGFLLGLLVLAALGWAVVRGSSRVRLGALWFLVALVPVHNVFVPLKIPTADRFLYLPLMGVAILVGELARRMPSAAKWMPPALLLLGVLAVARIGDWKSSETLLAAGRRVAPKSHRLIWTEASIAAEKAQQYALRGDLVTARRIGADAVANYQRYLRNSYPAEQTQALVELGDLLYLLGEVGRERALHENAFKSYLAARGLQREGIGRTTAEETRHTAERIVALAADLVVGHDSPGPTIAAGLEAAGFLKERYGFDDTGVRIVFRLADSIRVRGDEPEAARKGFDWVLDAVARLEARGARLPFVRAQARFYRAILRDRDFDRAELERAYGEYAEAASDEYVAATGDEAVRLRALAYGARCLCTIGNLFEDEALIVKGREILAAIPAVASQYGLALDEQLRNEIVTIEAGCGR